jgi:hypothetical protein
MPTPGAAACVIAQDFLQTVVIVDDQADLGLGSFSPLLPLVGSNFAAGGEGDGPLDKNLGPNNQTRADVDAEPSPDLVEPSDDALSVAEHGALDAKTIINEFAQLGLVCGVIRPENDEDIGPVVSAAAKRADVLVLDWWMHGDAGATSKAIIGQLAESNDQQDRMRLVIIYTAAQDLRSVAEEVGRSLDGAEVVRNRVMAGSIRLVVLAKPETKVDPSLAEDVVPFEAFPARVVKEFASAVEGLLSNVAFAALAAIRRNTHRMLNRFDRSLDPAFLGHRMLLPDPEDAERHLVEMILQEFSAVLESAAVGQRADYEAIRQLVSESVLVVDDVEKLSVFAARSGMSISELAMWFVKEGVSYPECGLSLKERKDIRGWASSIFAFGPSESGDVSSDIGKEWSMLMFNKLQYGSRCPELRLGVVVHDANAETFMLCIQPVCDSVRLMGPTPFPFLPLEEVSGGSDIVVYFAGKYHLLNVKVKLRDLLMVPFDPAGDASGVKAVRSADGVGWEFVPTSGEGARLDWVAELRDNFAHKFANRFAESASRVGTDDPEFFRKGAL